MAYGVKWHSSNVQNADCFKFLLFLNFCQEQKSTIAPNRAGREKKTGKVGVSRKEWGRGRGVGRRLAMHHRKQPRLRLCFPQPFTRSSKDSEPILLIWCLYIRRTSVRWVLLILFSCVTPQYLLQPSPDSLCYVLGELLCQHLLFPHLNKNCNCNILGLCTFRNKFCFC